MIRAGKNDVHRFTETVIKSGSRTLVTELMMKDTADLSRRDEKEFEESLEQKMSQWWQKMKTKRAAVELTLLIFLDKK